MLRRSGGRPRVEAEGGPGPVALAGLALPGGQRGAGRTGFHVLRHTAASAWLAAGLTVVQVAALLGHADPGITLKVYAHYLPAHRHSGEALAAAVGVI